jgi:hypothetical protein
VVNPRRLLYAGNNVYIRERQEDAVEVEREMAGRDNGGSAAGAMEEGRSGEEARYQGSEDGSSRCSGNEMFSVQFVQKVWYGLICGFVHCLPFCYLDSADECWPTSKHTRVWTVLPPSPNQIFVVL